MPAAQPSVDASPSHDRALVVWLSLAQLITWGSVFYTFALLLEPVERELGLTRAESSLAFSLALLAEGLLAWPVGRWIDAGHERAAMTGGSLLVALGLLLHSVVADAWSFYAVWALLGCGLAGTLYNPVFAVVTRRYPHDFRRAIITLTFLGGLASTVFIPLSDALIGALGWRHALWVLAALHLLVCAPLHAWWLRGAPRRAVVADEAASPSSSQAGAQSPVVSAVDTPQGSTRATPGVGLLSVHIRSAPFLLIGVFIIGLMGVTAALPPHMVSLLREAGLSPAWVILVPASMGVVQVLGRLLLFLFEHRFDLHRANALIPCLIPLGITALLAGSGQAWAALLFVLLYGLGNGMLTIVKGTAIAQYVSREHVASLNGALGLPMALARAATPWLLGLLWSPTLGYGPGLALLLAVSVVSVAALWAAQRLTRGAAVQ